MSDSLITVKVLVPGRAVTPICMESGDTIKELRETLRNTPEMEDLAEKSFSLYPGGEDATDSHVLRNEQTFTTKSKVKGGKN